LIADLKVVLHFQAACTPGLGGWRAGPSNWAATPGFMVRTPRSVAPR
jgi:hypothetical protein